MNDQEPKKTTIGGVPVPWNEDPELALDTAPAADFPLVSRCRFSDNFQRRRNVCRTMSRIAKSDVHFDRESSLGVPQWPQTGGTRAY